MPLRDLATDLAELLRADLARSRNGIKRLRCLDRFLNPVRADDDYDDNNDDNNDDNDEHRRHHCRDDRNHRYSGDVRNRQRFRSADEGLARHGRGGGGDGDRSYYIGRPRGDLRAEVPSPDRSRPPPSFALAVAARCGGG